MKNRILRIIARLTAFATIMSSVMTFSPAHAATFTSSKDTMTRQAISTTSNHTIQFTLPTGVDLDRTGNVDTLRATFPAGFTLGGTWVTGDFTFNDGTARTVSAVSQGAGTIDCTPGGGANDVCVAVDTTNRIFTVEVGAAYTASATAATIIFGILGTAGDGTLTNPGTAGAQTISYAMCDETAGCPTTFVSSHTSSVQVPIVDSDQVTVTATVASEMTFDLDTAVTDTESAAPYSVALGTITTTDSRVSGTTDSINAIWIDISANAGGGVVITVQNANGGNGLVSTSTPADNINSTTGAIADGTERYGLCVISTTATTGTLSKAAPYNDGTCATNSETNDVDALTTTPTNILNTGGLPIGGGRAQIAVNGSISGTTAAHNDYTDTLTFIATGTF